jgi:hypothetical protein
MTAMLTPSGLYRVQHCAASAVLPARHPASGPGARRGTHVHAYLAAVATDGDVASVLAEMPPAVRALCGSIDLDEVPRGGEAEVALAHDFHTGKTRRLEGVGARDYSGATPREVAGTVDLLLPPRVGRGPVVVDWKTTSFSLDLDTVRPQLDCYALMAAGLFGTGQAECRVGIIADSGAVAWECWELGAERLSEVAQGLQATARRITAAGQALRAGVPLDVSEGAWCRWCPAALLCPLTEDVEARLGASDPGTAYLAQKRLEQVLEAAKRRTKVLVEAGHEVTWTEGDGRAYQLGLDSRGALKRYRAEGPC